MMLGCLLRSVLAVVTVLSQMVGFSAYKTFLLKILLVWISRYVRSLLVVVIALLWYFSFLLPENFENFVQPLVTLSLQYLTDLVEFIVL